MGRPTVLLFGAGRFGQHYVRILKDLHLKHEIDFLGVVVKSTESSNHISNHYGISSWIVIPEEILRNVDITFIVTPVESHFDLISKCIKYAHVFVEKPVVFSEIESQLLQEIVETSNRTLMVGHIFRFHPVSLFLRELFQERPAAPLILGNFINPESQFRHIDASLEFLHLYDIIEYLWPSLDIAISTQKTKGQITAVSIQFQSGSIASLDLGWHGAEKLRILKFCFPDMEVRADFAQSHVDIKNQHGIQRIDCHSQEEILHCEVVSFLDVCKGIRENPVPLSVGLKVLKWAKPTQTSPSLASLPKVAVIGGGIFGCNASIQLAKSHSVTLFERNSALLQEGAWANNFRHHAGYHYPRSPETVQDVQQSYSDFESMYDEAIIKNVPNYYGIGKKDSYVDKQEFLEFCHQHNLKVSDSKNMYFSCEAVESCFQVSEMSYNYYILSQITKEMLQDSNIQIHLGTKVTDVMLRESGTKLLFLEKNGADESEEFDIVINATYANINWITKSLKIPKIPIRIDLAEVVVVHLDVEPISLTVIDGPFACMLPTGVDNEYTVYHVRESILDRYTPEDGLIRGRSAWESKALDIIKESTLLIPILKEAKYKESRIVHRAVQAFHEHDDSRVSEVYKHGFDCYSILSGKIVSCVSAAKKIQGFIDGSLLFQL